MGILKSLEVSSQLIPNPNCIQRVWPRTGRIKSSPDHRTPITLYSTKRFCIRISGRGNFHYFPFSFY